jgi:transcriptional antiterminator RfaH
MTWHVIMTKPQKESYAVKKLTEQGFTVYCPLRPHEKLVRHKRAVKHLPLFPRYLFIQQDEQFLQQQHVLRSTPGVSQLIKQGEKAISVKDEVIDSIRSLEQSFRDTTESYFTQHEPVKIRDGVYQHLEAIYLQDDGEQRALLLIQLLQKDTILSVEKSSLQKT